MTSKVLVLIVLLLTDCKNSSLQGVTPPSPWIDSRNTAADFLFIFLTPDLVFKSINLTSPISGSNGFCLAICPVILNEPIVLP